MTFLNKMVLSHCRLDLTRLEFITLAVLSAAIFVNGVNGSLLNPFYPQEAEKRGATASEYGLVFGIQDFASFLACIVIGKYMDKLNTKYLANCGVIVSGFSCVLFGWLDLIDTHFEFIGMSLALNVVNALGLSANHTACYTISASVLSSNVATSFAVLECVYSLGFALGPTFGGYLYEVGGFKLPFLTVGIVYFLLGGVVFLTVPNVANVSKVDTPKAKIFSVLKMMPVILGILAIMAAYLSLGFYQDIMEPHLRQFNLRPVTVGAIFGITSFTYILTTPLVSRLCDTVINPKTTIVIGSLLIITSFSLVGPLPFLPINTTLWMVYLGMVVHGLGMSCSVVPGFIIATKAAINGGLADDVTTYGVVTAVTSSATSLGDFIGPTVGGVLLDTVGFRKGSLFVIAVYLSLMVFMAWLSCKQRNTYSPTLAEGQINSGFSLSDYPDERGLENCAYKTVDIYKTKPSFEQVYGSTFDKKN